jgi:hypothetical protein
MLGLLKVNVVTDFCHPCPACPHALNEGLNFQKANLAFKQYARDT